MDFVSDTDHPTHAAPVRVSRRVLLGGAAASAFLVACGSSDDGSSSDADAGTAGDTNDTSGGDTTGIAFGTYVVAQRFPQDVQEPGLQRLPISLAGADGRLVPDGPDMLSATVDDADGNPLDIELSTVRRDLESGPYYSFRVPIETPGIYYLMVEGGPEGGAAFQVMEPGSVAVPGPGDPMPPFETPTVDDNRGVDPICTREPEPCPFHDVTLTDALLSGKPVAYLIGTPAFCQTGTCAPALDSMIDVQDRFGDSFTWVHAEVYTDNTATTPAPAVGAANLTFEPALFVIAPGGTVIERLDAVWDESELVEVLERARWPEAAVSADGGDSGEAGAAAAGARSVGVRDGEPGLVEPVLVVERGAFEQLRRGRVDDDLDGSVVAVGGLVVVGGDVAVEEHLVGEAAAATRSNGDAQCEIFGTLVGEQLTDLDGGGIGERDHSGTSWLQVVQFSGKQRSHDTACDW